MPRLFIAIELPGPLREEIHAATDPLRTAAPEIAWTRPDRLHLTLRFLGSGDAGAVGPLSEMLEQVGRRHPSFTLEVGGTGAFPTLGRPRVVWLGVQSEPRLELLQHDIEAGCVALGYEPEGRPFRPHLTLGRVREPADRGAIRALGRVAEALTYRTEIVVQSIDLMRSDPGPGGSLYSSLTSAPLRTG